MNTASLLPRAAAFASALLLAGCAAAPASPRGLRLQLNQSDYAVYRIEADALGSYEVRDYDETVYLTRRLPLDEEKLQALAHLAQRSGFYTLPADLADLPQEGDCSAEQAPSAACPALEHIVITSDCGPDWRLRISDGNRSHEVHWECGLLDAAQRKALQPLLAAIDALFAEHPTVANAPPPRRWRR
ncbi:hypothetical protein [Tahibacter harae]|uniref:DUF4136 domain-containing protein n=1 Tax=Tahibacter harae TaxID=2963937 RepID=A0ABT1QYA2_9GAMM|nr:hypothetical protein [Tahibacter harae]MCQ4167253.1 hypothetical protein [Tahibacter harae]